MGIGWEHMGRGGWECNLKEKEWDGNRMGAYGKRRMGM